jgi:hypothetical protein
MGNLIAMVLLGLLIASVLLLAKPEEEKYFWGKLVLYYLTYLLSINLGLVQLPVLIVAGFARLHGDKPRLNKRPKNLALILALIAFLGLRYVLPAVQYSHLGLSRELYTALLKFDDVQSVSVLTSDLPMQEAFRLNGHESSPYVLLTAFVLHEENMASEHIVPGEYFSPHELRTRYQWEWSVQTRGSKSQQTSTGHIEVIPLSVECYLSFIKDNAQVSYFGVVASQDDQFYLKYAIRGRLRSGTWGRAGH